MKKCKTIIYIVILILMILISISTKSYANTNEILNNVDLKNGSLASINSQIVNKLARYGYPNEKFLEPGNRTVIWDVDNLKYTANIEITKKGTIYSGCIIKLKSETLDGSIQAPISNSNSSADPIENPDFYKPTDTTGKNTEFIELGNTIIGIIRTVGIVISVISLMVIGIRYMFGSTQDRASYKETMVPYLIGAIMLFTITTMLGIIYDLVNAIDF